MRFTVRVYVNQSAPIVLPGGTDPLGTYIETRQASGSGNAALPGKRVTVDPKLLRPLPAGSDADCEYLGKFPSGAF
jgi:hypothetical protein